MRRSCVCVTTNTHKRAKTHLEKNIDISSIHEYSIGIERGSNFEAMFCVYNIQYTNIHKRTETHLNMLACKCNINWYLIHMERESGIRNTRENKRQTEAM